ncbi:MAG TPA: phosphoribosylaminoimidazolesuccinocarboxamide synthase [Gammaproteobacteria bacterium]|nr:phosphoribosylaminoimidazolesuccinocarboxamide synthase [Gammaproteobacteria bacterium]
MLTMTTASCIYETDIQSLPCIYRGKVRDIYRVDEAHILIIATDRVSAFDVIMPNPMPEKGKLLTQISMFWFEMMQDLVPNHLADMALKDVLPDPKEFAQAEGRSMLVKKLDGIPVEAVVRGYLIGSGWKDYQASGAVCGVSLPPDLPMAAKLPQVIFTPATKAEVGDHDENISLETMESTVGKDLAERIRAISIAIYQRAADYAANRGIIIADTKFEFGLDKEGTLTLMDEILTPDSSRFWPADHWQEGQNPPSYDKQFIRDYLSGLDWDKTAPGPTIPDDILQKTASKYREAIALLSG